MKPNVKNIKNWKQMAGFAVLTLGAIALLVIQIKTESLVQAEDAHLTFQSPAEAGTALLKAASVGDESVLERILGVDTKRFLRTGDSEADKAALEAFTRKYEKMNRWIDMSDGSRVLYIGADNFAFPVPLAKNSSGKWYFDGIAGAEEIRARDIGRNELLTIDASSALASAQELYFTRTDNSAEYAQRIISTAGKQDGLYWPASVKENPSPLASLGEFPRSSLASLAPDQPLVIDGYSLRILTAQGDDAPGGAKNYIVNGKMTDGFAILATPVKYAETGIMTFITGSDGTVYDRDLGPDTAKIAAQIQAFDPTDDWSLVE